MKPAKDAGSVAKMVIIALPFHRERPLRRFILRSSSPREKAVGCRGRPLYIQKH